TKQQHLTVNPNSSEKRRTLMTQTKSNTTSPKRMKKEETQMKAILYSPDVLELKEEDMNPNRRTAVLVGALFLISTATFIVSNALITPLLASHNFLAAVADHAQLMIAAPLIALIEGTATAGIALALSPILNRQHPSRATAWSLRGSFHGGGRGSVASASRPPGGQRCWTFSASSTRWLAWDWSRSFPEACSNSSCRSRFSRRDST